MLLFLIACAVDADKPDPGADTDIRALPDCNADLPAADGVVHTTSGAFSGVATAGGSAWLGIPFAEPPVGDLRFRAPVPRACVPGVTPADAFGPACPQLEAGAAIGEEDCLQLNVWAPEDAAGDLPVLVWVHGGGNVIGSTSARSGDVAIYDGAALAERFGAVVVTTNYRLGALGFLAHEALGAESGAAGDSGAWGLRDQLLALGWVRDNIAAFGGNPGRVLLFGESAGAVDTCALVTSPLGAGLFDAALLQSGGCLATPLAEAEASGAAHATTLGCDTAVDIPACLRDLDVTALSGLSEDPIGAYGIPGQGGFGPVVDGVVLVQDPFDALVAGAQNDVPLVVGANSDETSQWVPTLTDAEYEALVRGSVGRYAADVLALYPLTDFDTPREAWVAVTTDATFVCPARQIARAAAESQTSPVYRYFFSNAPNGASGAAYGAWHGLEILFVFQQLDAIVASTGYRADAGDYAVESAMGAAWVALAATGSPDADALPAAWPAYDPATDPYLDFGDPLAVGAGLRTARCDLWDEIGL